MIISLHLFSARFLIKIEVIWFMVSSLPLGTGHTRRVFFISLESAILAAGTVQFWTRLMDLSETPLWHQRWPSNLQQRTALLQSPISRITTYFLSDQIVWLLSVHLLSFCCPAMGGGLYYSAHFHRIWWSLSISRLLVFNEIPCHIRNWSINAQPSFLGYGFQFF